VPPCHKLAAMSRCTDLAETFLQETIAESPVFATQLGVDGFDDQLDDLSESAIERRRHRSAEWLHQFEQISDAECASFDERIDRDLILSLLRGRAILDDWLMWRRQPDMYVGPGLSGVFLLLLHRLKSEPELASAVAGRLRQVPRVLEDGRRNIKPDLAPGVYVERALRQARAGARYVRELLPGELSDGSVRAEVAEAGAVAGDALDAFAAWLEQLLPNAHGEWAIGHERYTRLLRERELLGDDASSLRERGRREYDRIAEELRRSAQVVDGTDDWPAVLRRLNKHHPLTPETMRQSYAEETERARQFLHEHDLVSFPPGEECVVEPSPPFQRPVLAVASYNSPPPFSAAMRGHFFVPYPPDGASEEEVQQRLENNSYASIPTTSVHEAYPGHHWHLVTLKEHAGPIRRTFRTPYLTEGWGLYAEQLMREQGYFTDPRHEMCQFEATLFRAARIIVDTGLHIGDLSFDEAVEFMEQRANLPAPTARAEVGRYCSWPTQAAAYLTGCLEIVRIRERFFKEKGGSLREFHDRLGRSGALPIALAEQVALS
jgi:uncharacterized protein (DUF885 family)